MKKKDTLRILFWKFKRVSDANVLHETCSICSFKSKTNPMCVFFDCIKDDCHFERVKNNKQ